MVWHGDTEGVESFLASGNAKHVNRRAVGEPTSWAEHSEGHVHYGLGTTDMKAFPVHYAAVRGHLDTLQILLDHGGSLNCKSEIGFTPRETVCSRLTVATIHNKQQEVEKMRGVLQFLDTYASHHRQVDKIVVDKTADET